MVSNIAIVDYGVGNIHSIRKAIENAGADVSVTNLASELDAADAIVLPGVGAFGSAMESLGENKKVIRDAVSEGKHILGICLGTQLFADWSSEGGKIEGLGLIEGGIVKLPESVKVPHIGWNTIRKIRDHPFLNGVNTGDYVYYVHSYYYDPSGNSVLAVSDYGVEFPGVVGKGTVIGTQFHPEKSGKTGLRMLDNFVKIVEDG
ncbi:MAG: imidazole glycerol phosphate synthase subunit HisH [Candidatus Hadarchaeota archaeon]